MTKERQSLENKILDVETEIHKLFDQYSTVLLSDKDLANEVRENKDHKFDRFISKVLEVDIYNEKNTKLYTKLLSSYDDDKKSINLINEIMPSQQEYIKVLTEILEIYDNYINGRELYSNL